MTPPSATVELASESGTRQQSPSDHPQIRIVSHSASRESLRRQEEHILSRQEEPVLPPVRESVHSDVDVLPHDTEEPSGHRRHSSEGLDRHSEDVQIVLHRDLYEERPEGESFSDEKEVVVSDEKEVHVHSPPLTGKDSAYSSVSGASFASPTSMHPRSASAQSSVHPRAQFGLFPSSGTSTPKQSMPGRHGALSPAMTPRQMSEPSVILPPRASTSLDNHLAPSRNRLLRKSSLSSLKKLFSKKKHSSVETIIE